MKCPILQPIAALSAVVALLLLVFLHICVATLVAAGVTCCLYAADALINRRWIATALAICWALTTIINLAVIKG